MSIETEFAVCCLEEYKFAHKMTGAAVIELFKKYNVVDYLIRHYEALHTTSLAYCVEDVDLYLSNRKIDSGKT